MLVLMVVCALSRCFVFCREQFADRLEVIAYPERKRRLIVGLGLGVSVAETFPS